MNKYVIIMMLAAFMLASCGVKRNCPRDSGWRWSNLKINKNDRSSINNIQYDRIYNRFISC